MQDMGGRYCMCHVRQLSKRQRKEEFNASGVENEKKTETEHDEKGIKA